MNYKVTKGWHFIHFLFILPSSCQKLLLQKLKNAGYLETCGFIVENFYVFVGWWWPQFPGESKIWYSCGIDLLSQWWYIELHDSQDALTTTKWNVTTHSVPSRDHDLQLSIVLSSVKLEFGRFKTVGCCHYF